MTLIQLGQNKSERQNLMMWYMVEKPLWNPFCLEWEYDDATKAREIIMIISKDKEKTWTLQTVHVKYSRAINMI